MLLHDLRDHPAKGILFHWSNYKHWRETAPLVQGDDNPSARWFKEYQYPRSCCRGLLAILQVPVHSQNASELSMILEPAVSIITSYFAALDRQSKSQKGAFSSLDGVEVLSAAVGLIYITQLRIPSQPVPSDVSWQLFASVQKPLQLLTQISDRFKALRGLGDALQSFLSTICNGSTSSPPSSSLSSILTSTEIEIPQYISSLMLQCLEARCQQGT